MAGYVSVRPRWSGGVQGATRSGVLHQPVRAQSAVVARYGNIAVLCVAELAIGSIVEWLSHLMKCARPVREAG